MLRALLLQCAWSAVRHGDDPDLRNASTGWLPHWSQTSDRGGDAGNWRSKVRRRWRTHLGFSQPAPAVFHPGNPSDPGSHGTLNWMSCAHLLVPFAHRTVWTLQSLAGVDRRKALLRPTNNNWWVSPRGAHEWQSGPLHPVRRRERPTAAPGFCGRAAAVEVRRCMGYSREGLH